MSIKGGSIYYTVGVDRKSLADAMRQVEALGKAAARANGAYTKGNAVLSQYEDEVRKLSKSISTLNNDFKAGSKDPAEYRQEMSKLEQDALALRGAIENLGSSVVATSQDEARAASMTQSLSASLKQTSQAVAGSKGQFDSLGDKVTEAQTVLVGLNAEVRKATQTFEAGDLSAREYATRLADLKLRFDRVGKGLKTMSTGANLSTKSLSNLSRVSGQVTRGLTAIQKGTTRATGAMTQLELKSMLSYGGLTLLNDRIFQMSPALGILTNQLMFSVKGFQAFLRAAMPIVAVAGTILAVIGALAISLRSGVGLEAALADVRKTTNLTNIELVKLTTTFQNLSKEIPLSTMELLGIARVAGQLGITGRDNIERFSEAIAKLSIATDIVGEEGATSLARFLQATGTNVDALGAVAQQVGNILNELENTSAATAAEILAATSYTQGLASQANASRAQILGLNAALLSLGVKAEAGGSAVVRTVAKIQSATVEGGEALDAFASAAGMTTESFADLVNDSPVEAFLALAQGMNDTAEAGGNLNQVLADIGIREVRERRALLALAQGADTFAESLESANREALLMTSLQKEVEIQSNTAEAKIKLLGARFATMSQQLGIALVPAFKALLDMLIGIVDVVVALTSGWNYLMAAFGAASTGIPRVTEEYQELNEELGENGRTADIAAEAIGKLSRVSSRSGLLGAIQDLAASLNEEGREALGNFAEATVLPLLAQGKLKDAAMATAEFMANDLVRAAKVGELEALSSLQAIDSASYESVRDRVRYYSDELLRLDSAIRDAPTQAAAVPFLIERDALREVLDDISPDFYRLRELIDNRATEIGGIRDEIDELDAAIAEITNINSFEDLRDWAQEFFGDPLSGLFGGFDDDGTGTGGSGESPLAGIMRSYREESKFLIAMMEDQGNTIEAQRAQSQGALENAQRTKEALYRLLSSEDLDPTLVSGIFDAISDMDRVISDLGVLDPLASAVAWVERLAAEVRFGYKSVEEATDLISPKLAELEEEAATALDEFGLNSVQYQDLLDKIGVLRAGLEGLGEVEPPVWFDPQADRRAMAQDRDRSEQFAVTGPTLAEMHDILGRDEHLRTLIEEYEERKRINELLREAAMVADQERRASLGAAIAARAERAESLARAQLGIQEDRRRMASSREVADYLEEQAEAELLAQARSRTRSDEMAADAARRGSLAQSIVQNYEDEQDAVQRLEDAVTDYAETLEEIEAIQFYGFMDEDEALEAQISAARSFFGLMIEETGRFSEETRAAALELQGLIRLLEWRNKLQGQGDDEDGPPPDPTVSYGINFGPANTMLMTFVNALGAAAEQSAILGSAFNAVKTTVTKDAEGNETVTKTFDWMMLFYNILGKVIEKSEKFGEVMELIDSILDPIVVAFDALLGAIMPTVEVIVALLTTALKPFVWIITDILAPILLGVATIIKNIWNALAAVIPWMNPTTDSGDEGGDDAPRYGSIAYARQQAGYLRELYEGAVDDGLREYYKEQLEIWEDKIRELTGEDPVEDPEDSMTAGTQISAITGPTRDLLMDLFRPLSILPSWTSMIQDIRNDVRSIATMGGFAPADFGTVTTAPMTAASVTNNTISIQSLTVTTQAKDAKSLFNEISSFAYKERRGGK